MQKMRPERRPESCFMLFYYGAKRGLEELGPGWGTEVRQHCDGSHLLGPHFKTHIYSIFCI